MKKIIQSVLLGVIAINMAMAMQMTMAYAAVTPLDTIIEVGSDTQLPDFETGQHPDAPADYLQPGVGTLTSPIFFALDLFKYAMSTVAIIVVIIQAIKLVSSSEDEKAQNAKNVLLYGIIGLIVIQLAAYVVTEVFFGQQGDTFESLTKATQDAAKGVSLLRSIAGLINVFLGTLAVLVIVIRGFTVITSTGDEEALSAAKKHILYAVLGLVVVGLSELIVKGFIFPANGEKLSDIQSGKEIIVMLTNYLASFIVLFTFVILVYTGYRYVISGGNEEVTEKVKKSFLGALIGLILAIGAFAIINTVIKLEPGTDATPGLVDEGQGGQVEIIN